MVTKKLIFNTKLAVRRRPT